MRTILIALIVLIIAFGAYAYSRNPAGCKKVVKDIVALFNSVCPIRVHVDVTDPSGQPTNAPPHSSASEEPLPEPATPAPSASSSTTSSVPLAPTPPTPVPSTTSIGPFKPWSAPAVMPFQPNWTWATSDGKIYQNVHIVKVEADCVTILGSDGGALVPISTLAPDLRKQLNYDPEAASQAAAKRRSEEAISHQAIAQELGKKNGIAALVFGNLVSAGGTEWNPAANSPSPDYYALYYSAHWCPPCRSFTPQLVQWYRGFKPAHPNFELIFVSEDQDENAMADYMKTMDMPWPAVRFLGVNRGSNGSFKGSGIDQYAGSGIPDLVLVDAGGKILADSFNGTEYVGPEHVLHDIESQLAH
jgi:nucleoredoxin